MTTSCGFVKWKKSEPLLAMSPAKVVRKSWKKWQQQRVDTRLPLNALYGLFLSIQDLASNFSQRQTQADLCQLAETINRCLDHFRSKSSLAKQISNGLKVTCADNGEQMALQPLSNIPEWRGETARRTLWDMTQARLIATSQKHAGDNDEEQEEEQKANNKGSTSGCT